MHLNADDKTDGGDTTNHTPTAGTDAHGGRNTGPRTRGGARAEQGRQRSDDKTGRRRALKCNI